MVEPRSRASPLEEGLVLALAVAAGAVARLTASGLPLAHVLLPVFLIEAYGPDAPRSRAAAARRAGALGVALATGLARGRAGAAVETALLVLLACTATAAGAREAVRAGGASAARFGAALALVLVDALARASPDHGLAATVALAAAFALVPEERFPEGLERVAWIGLALRLLDLATGPPLREIARARGLALAALALAVASAGVLFAVARAFAPRGRPGRAASALATALAALAAVEGGLHVKQKRDPDFYLEFTAEPLTATGPREMLAPGVAPRPDCRDHVFSPKKEAGTLRVAILGGSSVFGLNQKRRENAFPGRLEVRLGALLAPRRVEVLCLAYPGYTSDDELALVLGHALAWEIDLFLAIDGYNDITYLAGRRSYPGETYFWPQHRFVLGRPILRTLLRRSLLLRPLVLPRIHLPPPMTAEHYAPGASNGFFQDGLVANEAAIAALARDAGARFAWASLPLVSDRVVVGPNERRDFRWEHPQANEEVMRRCAEVRARVGPAVLGQGGAVLDLPGRIGRRSVSASGERWFGNDDDEMSDDCHYTSRGMDVLAEETVAALVETKLLESR